MPDLDAFAKCQPRPEERVLNGVGGFVLAEPARAEQVDSGAVALVERSDEGASRRVGRPYVTSPCVLPPR
jgi:hypothetical protein